jgi:phage terminase large subunit-like protein
MKQTPTLLLNVASRALLILFVLLPVISSAKEPAQSLIGEWKGKDSTGATATMIFREDGAYQMIQGGVAVIGSSEGVKVTWRFDATKNPMQLDIHVKGDKGEIVMPMIVRFVSDKKIQVGMAPDMETRPSAFSPEDSQNQVTLAKD